VLISMESVNEESIQLLSEEERKEERERNPIHETDETQISIQVEREPVEIISQSSNEREVSEVSNDQNANQYDVFLDGYLVYQLDRFENRAVPLQFNRMRGSNRNLWKRLYVVGAGHLLITTLVLLSALIIDRGKACEKPPLRTWSSARCLLQIMMFCGHLYLYRKQQQGVSSNALIRSVESLTRFINFSWLIWFTVGIAWIFAPQTSKVRCETSSPILFSICSMLIITEMIACGILCSFNILYYLIQRIRGVHPRILDQPDDRVVDRSTIKKMTETKKFSPDDASIASDDANCAICLENYAKGEELRVLRCGHHFHKSCLDPWLKEYNKACPLCKADIDAEKQPKKPVSLVETENVITV